MKTDISPIVTHTAKYEFDLLSPLKNCQLEVRPAVSNEVKLACNFCKDAIPNSVTSTSLIKKVVARNDDNIFIFMKNKIIVGVYAMLMLRPLGLEHLLLDEFDSKNPKFLCLTKTGEIPAAIYLWAIVGPGVAIDGIRQMSQFLQQPKYLNINLFTRPVTNAGVRLVQNLGYQPLNNISGGLYRYVRLVNRDPKLQRAA